MLIDMQQLINSMNAASKQERSNYHMTLGKLIEKLKSVDGDLRVVCSDNQDEAPGEAMSYRGYYSDLAFKPTAEPVTVGALLARCEAALDTEMTGYKGGEFRMGADTPLWVAPYGSCPGRAVMDIVVVGETAALVIKQIED
jgi:hypothetical protein